VDSSSSTDILVEKLPQKLAESPSINTNGEFADALRQVIKEYDPRRLLETGTFDGLGSTAIISESINPLARLITIECDFSLYAKAVANTRKFGHKVDCRNGLSIPSSMLPTKDEIVKMLSECPDNLNKDYPEVQNLDDYAIYYLDEMKRDFKEDDLIKQIVSKVFGGKLDFAILDSAGHLGWLEFACLLNFLESPCIIALDDVNHIKHYKSMEAIRSSKVFTILNEGDERYGWAIARYDP